MTKFFKKIVIVIAIINSFVTPAFAQSNASFDKSFSQFLKDVQTSSIKNRDWNKNDWDHYISAELIKLPITDKSGFYVAVQSALNDLGDHHSFLMNNDLGNTEETQPNVADLTTVRAEDGIGIITLSTFTSDDPPNEDYITRFHHNIDLIRSQVSKGWIINLQNNLGGNMYPMIACLSDFWINKGLGGFYFYGPSVDDKIQKLTFDGKTFIFNNNEVLSYKNKYAMGTITLPTIVLISEKTGSSAEFLALALERQPQVTLAGQTSHGLATGNEPMSLPNNLGYYMLTTANDLDKYNMPLLSEKIEPLIPLDPTCNQIDEAKKIIGTI